MKQPIKSALLGGASLVAVASTVLIPAAAFAASTTANSTISAVVNPVISMTGGTTVTIPALTPTTGGNLSSASDTVAVTTNDTAGYILTLADSDATTTLVSGANTIAASSYSVTAGNALTSNTWGFAVPGKTGFDATYSAENNAASSTSKWSGMPASGSPYTLKSTATVASADPTTVWYAVKVNSSQASGTYTDAVTYTATTN